MSDLRTDLPGDDWPEPLREMCIGNLSRVGGRAWAEREFAKPEVREQFERIMADVFNRGASE